MMKKILFGIVLFSALMFGMTDISEADELAVNSNEVSVSESNIAKENWENYVNNYLINSNNTLADYYLGNGFLIETTNQSRVSAFPIVEKETKKIAYTLQVSNGSILLSEKLGEKLNEVSEKTTIPISVFADKQSYFYQEGNDTKRLVGEDNIPDYSTQTRKTADIINITDTLEESNEVQTKATLDHVLLPWTVYDIQTTMPWCEYYSINAIVNNLAGKEIMNTVDYIHTIHPNATDAELADEQWIIKQTILDQHDYLKKHYNMSIKWDAIMFASFEKVKNELKTRKAPFVVDVENIEGTSEGHAIVQLGYTASNDPSDAPYYYYWNPWWQDIFVVSSDTPYMQLSTYKFTPYRAQYNFSKPNLAYAN